MISWFDFYIYLAQIDANTSEETPSFLGNITFKKVLQAIIAITLAYGFLLGARSASNWLSERVPLRFRPAAKQSVPFIQATIVAAVILYILSLFVTLSTDKVLALTGTVAVALGFAFKDYASSLIAGVVALFETPYRVGDRVQIGENYGEIVNFGLRGIALQTADDNIVFIPHNKIWNEPISNANNGALEAQVTTDFYLAHGVDTELVIKILLRAAYTSKYTQLTMPIQCIVEEQLRGTHFKLKSYPMDARDEFIYKTDLTRRVKQAFTMQNLPYPQGGGQFYDLDEE
jgi:small-conductance mechanosensitive channel